MAEVRFRGEISGRVPLRPGETRAEAVARAEATLLALTSRGARRLEVGIGLTEDRDTQPNPLKEAA